MLPKNKEFITALTKKKFTYRVRCLVPECTGRTALFKYEQILKSFVDLLIKQLKRGGHHKLAGGGGSQDGYDNIKGKFIERSIEVNVNKGTTDLSEKIIWVE